MSNKKKVKNYRMLYLIAGVIVIFVLAINFFLNKKNDTVSITVEEKTEEQLVDDENKRIIAKLKDMEERDRMEYYFGVFLDYIESGKYNKAYNLLYPTFKKNYFPTLESFTTYMKKTFSEMSNIEHENIERNGDVYVLWINITDALNGRNDEKKKMNIVIRENDYNDFELSFSVI